MTDTYSVKNMKKIRWGVLEENNPISLYPVMYPGWCGIIRGTGKILGKPQRNIINLNQGKSGIIFADHKEWTELGEYGLKKTITNPAWALNINRRILKSSDDLTKYSSRKIFRTDLRKLSKKQLYLLYKTYLDRHESLYNYAIIPVYLDFYKPHLTNYLNEFLHARIKETKLNKTAKECFALLTVPQKLSKVQEEEKLLLNLAIKLKKYFSGKKIDKKLIPASLISEVQNHASKFKYLGYNFEGPAFTDSYFWRRLNEMLVDHVSPEEKLQNLVWEKKKAKTEEQRLIKQLKIDKKHQKLLEITKEFIYSKDYRKMALVQSYYEIEPLLRELAKRFNLKMEEIRNCLLDEVKNMASGSGKPEDLAARVKGCLFVVLKGKLPGRVFVDSRFRGMRHYLLQKEDFKEVNFFHGQTASLGKAQGRARIINTKADLKKMKPGNILVSQMTNPDLVPAMKISAAIVTDLGGVTCHAAIVSRELKKPCIIGTKIATRILKDGDMVEVDANMGTIKKL